MIKKELLAFVTGSSRASLGFIQEAVRLAKEKQLIPTVVIAAEKLTEEERRLIESAGAEKIIQLSGNTDNINIEPGLVTAITELVSRDCTKAALFEYSALMSSVAPAAAARLGLGITADCTELRWDDNSGLLQIRPTFGGRKIAVNRSVKAPYIATVRRGVFPYSKQTGKAKEAVFEKTQVPHDSDNFSILEVLEQSRANSDLSSAEFIVSGGLGMGSRENYSKLYRLAELCNASVGASRAAVAAGYASYSHQVGQTGLSVNPKIYIAFGISGAVQHLSGIMNAEKVIAVNLDPKAPIHQYSDYSIIADCNEVVDELIRLLESE